MQTPSERLYALAERLLDVQERDVANLRGRMPGVAAAAAVAATLLSPPATSGGHPSGLLEIVAFVIGIAGIAAVIVALLGVLWSRELVFAVSPSAVGAEAHERGLMADPGAFEEAMAETLESIAAVNALKASALHRWFGLALLGLAAEVAGLGTAAGVAS